MKTSNIIAVAALSLLAAAGAQAQTARAIADAGAVVAAHSADPYAEGFSGRVAAPTGLADRAAVNAEAVVASRSVNPYAEGFSGRVAPVLASGLDRNTVRAVAVATAHAPNQNLDRKAYFNSEIPAEYTKGTIKFRSERRAAL